MSKVYYQDDEVVKYVDENGVAQVIRKKQTHECDNKPECSKREDLPSWAARATMMPGGLCYFEDGTVVDSKQPI